MCFLMWTIIRENVTILLVDWMLNKLVSGRNNDSNTRPVDIPMICVSHVVADHQKRSCFALFCRKLYCFYLVHHLRDDSRVVKKLSIGRRESIRWKS